MTDKDGFYSTKVIADLFGLSERRVEQLAQKKIIPRVRRGLYDLAQAIKAYIAYLRGHSVEVSDLDHRMMLAKTKEREAKATISQISLEQKQGRVITLDDVKRQWSARLIEFKAAMLEMPKLAAFRFTDPDVRMHVEEELNVFVVETLSRYSRSGIFPLGDGDNASDASAAEGDNGESMG